jgi:DnaK suppressor protein
MAMNIERYKRRLLELERQLAGRIGEEVETARTTQDDQPEVGDAAHANELRDEYFALAETDTEILAEVRAALRRIDDGTYGKCGVDGQPIDEKRLESVPWTRYCLRHQQEIEARASVRTPSL